MGANRFYNPPDEVRKIGLERFQASGFQCLRAYANYKYVTVAPFKILVASMIGAGTGVVGGFLGSLGLRRNTPAQRDRRA